MTSASPFSSSSPSPSPSPSPSSSPLDFKTTKRVLIKLSGEALGKGADGPFEWSFLKNLVGQIAALATRHEVALVVGGGNFFRGATSTQGMLSTCVGDQVGMLATVMNGRVLQELLQQAGCQVSLFSSPALEGFTQPFLQAQVETFFGTGHSKAGYSENPPVGRDVLTCPKVAIFVGGTGQPYFTTDTAAVVWALRTRCSLVLKGTQVDGVYSADPRTDPEAQLIPHLTYREVVTQQLKVMDLAALALAWDNGLPLVVFNLHRPHALEAICRADPPFTLIN